MWDTFWSAVAAVGTVGAVGWAVWTTLTERRMRIRAEEELAATRTASQAAERRRQADRVVAWYELVVDDWAEEWDDEGRVSPVPISRTPTLFVENHSDAPVFDMKVVMVDDHDRRSIIYWAKVLPPGNDRHELSIKPNVTDLRIVTYFNDLAGLRWERCDIGHADLADASLAEEDPAS